MCSFEPLKEFEISSMQNGKLGSLTSERESLWKEPCFEIRFVDSGKGLLQQLKIDFSVTFFMVILYRQYGSIRPRIVFYRIKNMKKWLVLNIGNLKFYALNEKSRRKDEMDMEFSDVKNLYQGLALYFVHSPTTLKIDGTIALCILWLLQLSFIPLSWFDD